MNKPNALFLTNEKYVDPSTKEGGVKFCTSEYIHLISLRFNVELFTVKVRSSFAYRLKKKYGFTVYNDYNVNAYKRDFEKIISEKNIEYLFLNLTNTIGFAKMLKKIFPSKKIILCSHGNESGDFLHEVVMHSNKTGIKKFIDKYSLGKMLCTESESRKYIDLVLTVSDVEEKIEKWIGAKKIYLVYRSIAGNSVGHQPVPGRIGFFGDLSHAPNFYGVKKLCEALKNYDTNSIELRLVSAQRSQGKTLAGAYSFIKYLGYLTENELKQETATWTFSLNPVFYYSRGVSTKLGKMLQWGLPVITSSVGMRGYYWKEGDILKGETPAEMAAAIIKNANCMQTSSYYKNEIDKMKRSAISSEQMVTDICLMLESY